MVKPVEYKALMKFSGRIRNPSGSISIAFFRLTPLTFAWVRFKSSALPDFPGAAS